MVSKATSQSSPLIWVALLLTLAAVAWTAMQSDEINGADDLLAEPAERIQSANLQNQNKDVLLSNETKVAMKPSYPWQQINRELETKGIKDLFASHSWEEKQKVVKIKPLPPPPPQAPPLPFTYMGKIDQGDGVQVFLMQNNKVLTVNVGENVNNLWRLDAESDAGLTFTYIPLDKQKRMSKGASSSRTNAVNGQFRPRPRNQSALRRQMQQLDL